MAYELVQIYWLIVNKLAGLCLRTAAEGSSDSNLHGIEMNRLVIVHTCAVFFFLSSFSHGRVRVYVSNCLNIGMSSLTNWMAISSYETNSHEYYMTHHCEKMVQFQNGMPLYGKAMALSPYNCVRAIHTKKYENCVFYIFVVLFASSSQREYETAEFNQFGIPIRMYCVSYHIVYIDFYDGTLLMRTRTHKTWLSVPLCLCEWWLV